MNIMGMGAKYSRIFKIKFLYYLPLKALLFLTTSLPETASILVPLINQCIDAVPCLISQLFPYRSNRCVREMIGLFEEISEAAPYIAIENAWLLYKSSPKNHPFREYLSGKLLKLYLGQDFDPSSIKIPDTQATIRYLEYLAWKNCFKDQIKGNYQLSFLTAQIDERFRSTGVDNRTLSLIDTFKDRMVQSFRLPV